MNKLNIEFPKKSVLFIGETGIGKTQLFKKWLLYFSRTSIESSFGTIYSDRENERLVYLTEENLIRCISKSEEYENFMRHLKTADIILIDEIFNQNNWLGIKNQNWILSRYYAFFDFLYSNRETVVIANSNHKISEIYPDISDSFLRRINEVFTEVIELCIVWKRLAQQRIKRSIF